MNLRIILIVSLFWNYVYSRERRVIALGKTNGRVKPPPMLKYTAQDIPEQYFDQILDHFNDSEISTWKQLYYVNDEFYKPGGPAFLFVGGEGPIALSWMYNGVWYDNAKVHNAICFQLEHRFYGKSHPTKDVTTENLIYLTSHQSLADLANFIDSMNEVHQLSNGTKWVTFGGSYPGNLAAWMRLKYPDRVHAAIVSSAPLEAKVDFYEYFEVVSQSLGSYNPQCPKDIRSATREMEKLLKTDTGRERLKDLFHLCNVDILNDKYDTENFFQAIAVIFASAVQYNDDAIPPNIHSLCEKMVNESKGTPIERYADISNNYYQVSESVCLSLTFNNTVNRLKKVNWEGQTGDREWFYQTCNEFGYYQTIEPNSIFGNGFLDYYLRQCREVYGQSFVEENIFNSVNETNKEYGGKGINVTRVFFLNGSLDPWHALGINVSRDPEKPATFIIGGAHAQDMGSIRIFDSPELVRAKKQVGNYLKKWLMI